MQSHVACLVVRYIRIPQGFLGNHFRFLTTTSPQHQRYDFILWLRKKASYRTDSAIMRAAQYFGIRDVRVVDVPEPVAKDNEAIVSIAWGGICGSDLHEYEEGKSNLTISMASSIQRL